MSFTYLIIFGGLKIKNRISKYLRMEKSFAVKKEENSRDISK